LDNGVAGDLADTALGGGMCSPLFQEVREKRGLVYSVSSNFISGKISGKSFILGAGTTKDNLDKLITCFADVVMRGNDLITEDDIIRARNMKMVGLSASINSTTAMAEYIVYSLLEETELELPSDWISRIKNMDTKHIRHVIDSLKTSPVAIGMAGPNLESQLEKFLQARR
jgi:predicted Zn-dependent peptidase